MSNANYITVTEFKSFNPELDFSQYTDTTISGMIQRASGNVDNYLQYSLDQEDIVDEQNEAMISSNGNLMLYTRKVPVTSVSKVNITLGTVNFNLTLTDGAGNPRYNIPSRGNYVIFPYQEIALAGTFTIRNFFQLRGLQIFTKISYHAGYSTIPYTIKDAVNLWTKDIFIRQSNPMDLAQMSQGQMNMRFRDLSDEGDSSLVMKAKNLLNSYRKVTS
jgi:hypothetical protein